MKGLLLKDFYLSKNYCKYYFLIILGFSLCTLASTDSSSFWAVFPSIYASMIPSTLQTYDEHEHWSSYSAALPYTRVQLVSVKYIDGLICCGFASLLSVILKAVKMLIEGSFSINELLFIFSISVAGGILPTAFMLPFIFKLGAEKGRLLSIICVGATVALLTTTKNIADNTSAGIQNEIGAGVAAAVLLATAALFAVSWLLSVTFYKKREV